MILYMSFFSRLKLLIICSFLFSPCFILRTEGSCYELSLNNICSNVLNYNPVFVPSGGCPSSIARNNLLTVSQSLFYNLTDNCAQAAIRWMCAKAFPPCSAGSNLPCQNLCLDLQNQCGSQFGSLSSLLNLPVCSSLLVGSSNNTNGCTALSPVNFAGSVPVPGQGQGSGSGSGSGSASPAPPVSRATCVTYPQTPGSVCQGVLPNNYQVYLSSGQSIAGQEFFIKQLAFSFASFPITCANRQATWLCEQAFPRCDTTTNVISSMNSSPVTLAVPVPPCTSECQQLNNDCVLVYFSIGSSASLFKPSACNSTGHYPWTQSVSGDYIGINVTNTDCSRLALDSNGVPLYDYPSTGINYAVAPGGMSISSSCLTMNMANVHVQYASCPAPFHSSTNYASNFNGGLCTLACPPVVQLDNFIRNVNIIMSLFSVISFFCVIFLLTTWLIFKEKRSQRFILLFLASLFIVYLSLFMVVIGTNGNFTDVSCKDRTTQCTWNDGGWCNLCLAQSIMMVFGVLSGTGWYCVIAMDLGLKVFFGGRLAPSSKKLLNYGLYAFGIIFPWPWFIAALSDHAFGSDGGVSWCFYHNAGSTEDYYFWGPVASLGGIVTIIMIAVVIQIAISSNRVNSRRDLTKYIRPLIFLFSFHFFIIFEMYVHWYSSGSNSNVFVSSAKSWIACRMGPTPYTCGDYPTDHLDLGVAYMVNITASTVGITIFFVYGNTQTFQLWIDLFRGLGLGSTRAGSNTSKSGAPSNSYKQNNTNTNLPNSVNSPSNARSYNSNDAGASKIRDRPRGRSQRKIESFEVPSPSAASMAPNLPTQTCLNCGNTIPLGGICTVCPLNRETGQGAVTVISPDQIELNNLKGSGSANTKNSI